MATLRPVTTRGFNRCATAGVFSGATMNKYALFTGASGAFVSTPDAAGIETAAGFTSEVECSLPSWTPASTCVLHGKWTDGTNRSWLLLIDSSSKLVTQVSTDGSTIATAATSTTSVSSIASPGQIVRFRSVYVADNGAAGRTTTHQYSLNRGVTWTSLDAPIVQAGTVALFNGTSALAIGAQGNGTTSFAGSAGLRVYSATLKNSGGTLVSSFNPARYTGGATFTASTGEVWTVAGAAKILAGPF